MGIEENLNLIEHKGYLQQELWYATTMAKRLATVQDKPVRVPKLVIYLLNVCTIQQKMQQKILTDYKEVIIFEVYVHMCYNVYNIYITVQIVSSLPTTLTVMVSLSLPIGLVTVHVYVPLSLVVTLLME